MELQAGNSRAENLYWEMREAISDGQLAAGSRVREIEVATRYGVSRTPVREALQRLAIDGLLEELPGQGLTVTNPSLKDILDAYLVREVLEGLATRLATERAEETDRLRIEAAANQMRASLDDDDPETSIKLFNVFDELVFASANSDRLYRMIYTARALQGSAMRSNIRHPGRLAQAGEERLAILEAFKAGDAAGAEEATKNHLRKARELRLANSLAVRF